MRTTVIPAQITTVEDKIAGNLNITQVLLLMSPVFFGMAMYALIPPVGQIAGFKIFITILVAAICVTLAIRIKEKLILDWISVYARFSLRPAYYIFDKNDPFSRDIKAHQPVNHQVTVSSPAPTTQAVAKEFKLSVQEAASFEQLLNSDKFSLQITPIKKGGVRVAIEQIQS